MAREEPLSPAMVLVLIRSYLTTGREEVAAGLSAALTTALEHRPSGTLSDDRPAWLLVFLEAANVSDDERVDEEAAELTAALRSEWPARSPSPQAMRGLASCLAAVVMMRRVQKDPPYDVAEGDTRRVRKDPSYEPDGDDAGRVLSDPPAGDNVGRILSGPPDDADVGRVLSDPPGDDGLLQAAIDELERIVGRAYEPGEGLLQAPGRDVPGTLEDHVTASAALLAAYRATARLPYSMLAEELMRVARRRWWFDDEGRFVGAKEREGIEGDVLIANCEAARVLAQISTLHADADYREAVVVADSAPGVTNFEDADRILAWLGRSCPADGPARAEYAIALGERLSLR